ncbi:MAG: HAD family hydrolase [Acetatifactor sp.]
MKNKILYVSDLDGTLLRNDQTTSEFTNKVINSLTKKGIVFSYATARSIFTSSQVTKGLDAKIPVITYNGAFIVDNATREVIDANYLDQNVYTLLRELFAEGIYPTIYSIVDGKERFSNYQAKSSKGTLEFAASRNDERKRIVNSEEELIAGDIFYISCIEALERIKPFYDKYKDMYHCVYQKDIYSGEQWFEIMSKNATKASAVQRLKQITQSDYVIVFGDGINDLEMFEIADECYAMANAVPELKAVATEVIGSNDSDGVAHWLEMNIEKYI